jgi:HK97 family phage prohead protease
MKTKRRMRLEIKEISSEGSFEGLLSPYGNVDGGGDVVMAGAFVKTMKDRGNKVPLLWQHKPDTPIGDLTLEDRPEGLWSKGQLLMALPEAQKAYLLIKAKIVKGLSIGFETIKDSVEGGVRRLSEIKLYEGSIVTFPMNESALIASVKGKVETKDDFNEELTEIQLQDAGYQMFSALRSALSSIVWADLQRDEKVTAVDVILQQFTDAYTAYFPMYLDLLSEMYGGMETWAAQRLEIKAGAKFSAATKEAIQTHCADVKDMSSKMTDSADSLLALLDPDAGTSKEAATPETKAAPKPEPAPDHSAISQLLTEFKGALTWN